MPPPDNGPSCSTPAPPPQPDASSYVTVPKRPAPPPPPIFSTTPRPLSSRCAAVMSMMQAAESLYENVEYKKEEDNVYMNF